MHGCQWSYDDLYNARRQAEIQAEANAKAFRREQERLDKIQARRAYEAEQARRREESYARVMAECAAHQGILERAARNNPEVTRRHAEEFERHARERRAKDHAERALEAEFGSESYICNRYWYSWKEIVEEFEQKYNVDPPTARQIIVWRYTEDSFEKWEDDMIEEFMGHRRTGTAYRSRTTM